MNGNFARRVRVSSRRRGGVETVRPQRSQHSNPAMRRDSHLRKLDAWDQARAYERSGPHSRAAKVRHLATTTRAPPVGACRVRGSVCSVRAAPHEVPAARRGRLGSRYYNQGSCMTIASGTRLGPYEIEAPLGAGGMGEVYRARDVRLDRTVAVKVLSQRVLHRAESRKRFEREARVVASLNHPHICALYDVGQHDGVDFLVMEFVQRPDSGRPSRARCSTTRLGPAPCVRDRRRPRRGASRWSRPPRPEASQHHADRFGREVARLWSGEAATVRASRRRSRRIDRVAVVPTA